jgi:pimeloyl-ACP methyl ester carboxylesterase
VPSFTHGETTIYYEAHGSGFPLLLFAPGAMNSAIELWSGATIDPLEHFTEDFRLIAMDQRNAGRSTGPLEVGDPWGAYARDQLALMDHLGIESFHVMGACIGSSFALKLIEQARHRVVAAVLQQPVGVTDGNEPLYEALWRGWADRLTRSRTDLDPDELEAFGTRMWGGRLRAQRLQRLLAQMLYATARPAGSGPLPPDRDRARDRRAGSRRAPRRAVEGPAARRWRDDGSAGLLESLHTAFVAPCRQNAG